MKNLPVPTAKDINEAHRLARLDAESAVKNAVRCGQLLMQAKAALKHGDFQPWIDRNCEFAYSTAALYMKAARTSPTGLEISSIRHLFPSGQPGAKPKAKPVTPEPQVMNPPESAAQGSEAGNQQKAHVMGIGAAHRAAETRPVEAAPPSVSPPTDFDFTDYDPEDDDAYKANIENVLMADDKLAAMHEQLKQCHREIAGLKASRDHYQAQAGEAVRLVKARDREIEKLKKELRRQAA